MWVRPFHTCLVCLCIIICYSKALEASIKEPSCDELRAMWRFSKRQSRAAEITNEIPTYRDPFAFNVWDEYARPRSAGRGGRFKKPPVYGTLVPGGGIARSAQVENSPERVRAFEEVMRLFGSSSIPWPPVGEGPATPRRTSFRYGGRGSGFTHPRPGQTGSFQHLKALIRNERARELQEQRMHEEAEKASAKTAYQPPRLSNDSPPTGLEGALIREKPSSPGKGVVAFPDFNLPSINKYFEEYMGATPQAQKYKYKLPGTNSL